MNRTGQGQEILRSYLDLYGSLPLPARAKSSTWMADVSAERLLRAIGGVPAFGHPERQPSIGLIVLTRRCRKRTGIW